MSYRGAVRGYKSYRDRGAQNGRSHRVPFPADSQSDLDENEDVRLPHIEHNKTQLRERRPQRNGDKYDSRIPLPERSRNDFGKREPRALNFDDSNAELPNSSSDFTDRNQRKSRINAVKRITFYRNGDKHFKGVEMVVSKQRYRSLDAVIDELSKAIPLPYGVRTVFTPGGSTITNINQLEDGRYYICSSGDQLIRNVNYGQKREKARSYDSERLSDASNSTSSSSRNSKISVASNGNLKPRVITVISEHDRNKKSKVLLNRKTVKSFEDVLKDISEILRYKVRELYTLQNAKVKGLSELFRDQDTFLAASSEKGFKRNLSNPSSLSSNGNSASPALSKRLQKSRKKSRHESLGTRNQVVTIKVKGQTHTYHLPSELDQFTVDNAPVSPPDSKLQLSWVYGYHGKDTCNNLHVLPSGEMLYFVATMVVIFNKTTNTQRHYTGHADDIKCLAVHPNLWYIATGQVSGLSVDQNELSHIRIWDAETLITLAVLALDEYSLSVCGLSFSQEDNGKQLACVDASDEDYHLTVWEWEDRAITQQSKGQSSAIVAVAFDPDDSKTIVTCGKEHVYFWRLNNTRMERKSGHFEKSEIPQFITCLEFSPNGDVITGDSNGSVMVWGKVSKKIKFVVKNAHEKSILCLRLLGNGTLLTGGLDGKLASWDANKYFNTPLREMQVERSMGGVCAIEPVHTGHGDDISVLVGLTSNDIVEGSFSAPFHPIVQSHKDAVDALAVHPNEVQFVSASWDQSVSLWNAESHQVIWKVHAEFPVKSADFYSTGDVLALGTSVGRWIVLSCESGMHVASFQDGTTPLTDLEYARDGEHIAVASEDGNIYVHAVYDEGTTYRRVGCCSSHTAPVMFLDWSLDGCFLQSLSTAYEHIVWEIGGFQREESQDIIRDIEWSTRNVMLGYDVAGVWPPQPDDGNLVNSSDLSWSRDLFAVGDEMGYIRLFRFPCTQPVAHYHQWRGHSCPVERMLFLTSDTYLITTGGRDICILQWSVEAQLPMLNEQEEYGIEDDMHQMEDSQQHLENESYHSDYSDDEQGDDYGVSRNAAKGKQDGGVKASFKNDRYARGVDVLTLEVPPGHSHSKTLQGNHSNRQTSLENEKGRNRRPPLSIQKNKSQTGSYAERFNKQKSLGNQNGNLNWSHDSADRSPVEPPSTEQWSDSEDPHEHGKRQMGRGGTRSRYPGRGRDRRQMR